MNKTSNIPEITLERYVLNELPPGKMSEIELLINNNKDLKLKVDKIIEDSNNFKNKYNNIYMVNKIRDKSGINNKKESKSKKYKIKTVLPSAVFASIIVIIMVFIFSPFDRPEVIDYYKNDTVRLKGSSKLIIYRKKNSKIEILKNGSTAREGDLLQVAYLSVEGNYGAIISIDGRKNITLHFPESEGDSTKISKNKKILLSSSYELDDAPEIEKFYFIISKNRFNLHDILKSAKNLTNNESDIFSKELILNKSIKQISVSIIKVK